MREIIKTYRQSIPALRFIGKKYGDSAHGYGAMWGEWFEKGWFDIIVKQIDEGFEFNPHLSLCFERYVCPRFTTPDEKGNVILDIGFFIK